MIILFVYLTTEHYTSILYKSSTIDIASKSFEIYFAISLLMPARSMNIKLDNITIIVLLLRDVFKDGLP